MCTRTALIALSALSLGCEVSPQCTARVEGARRDAVLAAAACDFSPDRLAISTCAARNPEPRNAWYATWCGLASVSCIRSNPDAMSVCFGEPETGLGEER